jgi:hypothetical protein
MVGSKPSAKRGTRDSEATCIAAAMSPADFSFGIQEGEEDEDPNVTVAASMAAPSSRGRRGAQEDSEPRTRIAAPLNAHAPSFVVEAPDDEPHPADEAPEGTVMLVNAGDVVPRSSPGYGPSGSSGRGQVVSDDPYGTVMLAKPTPRPAQAAPHPAARPNAGPMAGQHAHPSMHPPMHAMPRPSGPASIPPPASGMRAPAPSYPMGLPPMGAQGLGPMRPPAASIPPTALPSHAISAPPSSRRPFESSPGIGGPRASMVEQEEVKREKRFASASTLVSFAVAALVCAVAAAVLFGRAKTPTASAAGAPAAVTTAMAGANGANGTSPESAGATGATGATGAAGVPPLAGADARGAAAPAGHGPAGSGHAAFGGSRGGESTAGGYKPRHGRPNASDFEGDVPDKGGSAPAAAKPGAKEPLAEPAKPTAKPRRSAEDELDELGEKQLSR